MRPAPPSAQYALFDRIPLGVCVLAPDLEVRFWNTCLEDWTGIDRDSILGTSIVDRFPHLAEAKYRHRLQPIFEGGPPAVFSSQLHRHLVPARMPDGQLRTQHTVVTSVPSSDGQGWDALLSIQDVTDLSRRIEEHRAMRDQALQEVRERQRAEDERRRMEFQILHARKLESLGVLAGGIAHDFNNLLLSILGNADLAVKDTGKEHPAFEPLQAIVRAGQRAAELCDQMLAYAGKRRLTSQHLDLSDWVRQMASLLEISISKQAELTCRLATDLPPIEADPAQLRQVLVNLITNASESLGEGGGQIILRTRTLVVDDDDLHHYLGEDLEPGSFVMLEVSDTGSGMDAATQEKIFDPFFTTKFPGRGLGLAAVLGIVRSHRGALRVTSRPTQGATFQVILPIAGQSSTVPSEGHSPPHRNDAANTVLVVDDEEMVRLMARTVLQRSGFEAVTAEDGAEALDVFERHRGEIAAVLLDLTMPNVDGDTTFRELRRLDPGLPVVLTSGYTETAAADGLSTQGQASFLQKPYRPKELVAMIRRVIEQD